MKYWCLWVAALLLSVGQVASADVRPKDLDKGPDAEGRGDTEGKAPEKDPLGPIVELMRDVEKKLAAADTGKWTQAEQQRIVDALAAGDKAIAQLRELIKMHQGDGSCDEPSELKARPSSKPEKQKPQGSARSDSSPLQKKGMKPGEKPGSKPGEKPGSKPQGKQGQHKPGDPKGNKGEVQSPEQAKNNQKSSGEGMPEGTSSSTAAPSGAQRWGDLPMKQVRDILDAKRETLPLKWRQMLEAYYRKLAESDN